MIDKTQFAGNRIKPVGQKYDSVRDAPSLTQAEYFPEIDDGVKFDPRIHLNYSPAKKRISMEELGLNDGTELSHIGATIPFTLFSDQAVRIMRHEIMKKQVWEKYAMASNITRCIVRGYARELAPFTYAAWKHPETLKVISQEAGIDLQVVMDYEVGNVNFAATGAEDTKPVISWHYDSYPFVCVLMISDTTGMVGGETVFNNHRTGELCRIPDPIRGSATVLQGKYIEHQALKPKGGKERITMICSFIPKDPLKTDETIMATTACISHCNMLFQEWACYRMARTEARLKHMREELEEARTNGTLKFDFDKVKAYLKLQQQYLETTITEMEENIEYLPVYTPPQTP